MSARVGKWFLTAGARAPVFMLHSRTQQPFPQEAMPQTPPDDTDFIHSEQFLRGLMRRQLRLSVSCASAFLLLLFGLPLMNFFAPEFMATRVWGFTLSWLVLGVLFFPYVWIIARLFITRSMALEAAEVRLAADENKRAS
jgi:uncharacterized membrane protein (DUF485 family)